MRIADWPWGEPGRDLSALPTEPGQYRRIVVGLNVWNDLSELQRTVDSWYPHVEHVVAVDGVYPGTGTEVPESTDGTLEFLRSLDKVELVPAAWRDQIGKRNAYLDRCQDGDLLWVIDADEEVYDGHLIRDTPYLDVGWLPCYSPIYARTQQQPRVFRWRAGMRYDARHHWVYCHDELMASHQQGGIGFEHRLLEVAFFNRRGASRPYGRQLQGGIGRVKQFKREQAKGPNGIGHDPLQVLHTAPYDPGCVIYRLHSALNTTTSCKSAMATIDEHPFQSPGQHRIGRNPIVRDLLSSADVLHQHVTDIGATFYRDVTPPAIRVMHHHGTIYRTTPEHWNELDAQRAALRLVSNLELCQYGENLHYLPNPVPVARLQRLANIPAWEQRPFRIAHSPSKPELKGTEAFLRACRRVNSQGVKVEAVLIHKTSLRASLQAKATCHAMFDSFWLGMQCSGIEAAAMGIPVLAGDPDCHREYTQRYGGLPYTFVKDEDELVAALLRLTKDANFYRDEALRVSRFVATHHDYGAVTAHYLELLDAAAHWRERLRLGMRRAS